jgi:hypothetical protein
MYDYDEIMIKNPYYYHCTITHFKTILILKINIITKKKKKKKKL